MLAVQSSRSRCKAHLLTRSLLSSFSAVALSALLSATPVKAQIGAASLSPANGLGAANGPDAAADTAAELPPVLISELRTQGPGGDQDSFVELYNPTDTPLGVAGWSLQFLSDNQQPASVPIPEGIDIPAYGHLLFTGRQYSLNACAVGDVLIKQRIVGGVRLCDAAGQTVDAVGPATASAAQANATVAAFAAYGEGEGLPEYAFAAKETQFSCVRKLKAGAPQNTHNNKQDFVIVAVNGTLSGHAVKLGAPGPENLTSPVLHNGAASESSESGHGDLLPTTTGTDALAATGEKAGELQPIRHATATGQNHHYGTLTLRHRFVNRTTQPITHLRFCVTNITAGTTAAGTADMRLLNPPDAAQPNAAQPDASKRDAGKAPVLLPGGVKAKATISALLVKLDEPPAQPAGGGLNASVSVMVPLGGIAPGVPVDLEFLLGVEQRGHYQVSLASDCLDLNFEGDTETGKSSRLATAPTRSQDAQSGGIGGGRSGVWATAVSRQSTRQRNGGAGAAGGGGPAGAANPPLTAVLIFEGNTEDGVKQPTPAKPSPLNPSSASADGATGAIRLRFNGSLDAETASDATRYTVLVNGRTVAVESAAYDAARNSVVLALPIGSFHPGDKVLVKWSDLADAQGRSGAGQAGPLTVR